MAGPARGAGSGVALTITPRRHVAARFFLFADVPGGTDGSRAGADCRSIETSMTFAELEPTLVG